MQHLGSITEINGAAIPPVEVITFGSPCQDLSVAGNRAGLAGERSGLFMEAVRVIREMREATNGEYPAFVVWEQVPGAFSSPPQNKGEDFRVVLEELANLAAPGSTIPRPANGKWNTTGAIVADGWSIAWRVYDAQFWGVPQRRRRIALVMDFGGQRAPQIQFDPEGLPGHIAQGGTAGQEVTRTAGGGIEDASTAYCIDGNIVDRNAQQNGIGISANICPTLNTQDRHAVAFMAGQGAKAHGIAYMDECSPTLKAGESGTNQAPSVVIPFDTSQITSPVNRSNPQDGDPCPTLHAGFDVPAIAGTITTRTGTPCPRPGEVDTLVMSTGQANAEILRDLSPTLNCDHERPIIATAIDCRNFVEVQELYPTLQAKPNGGQSLNHTPPIRTLQIVRRLTPLECERLQGYPDGWTDIPPYRNSKGKLKRISDSAKYRMLGNSIALPNWFFVLSSISRHLPRGSKLGSLFDGIGGFPLVWELLHGQGTAIWASEIDEDCIAVTKYHFPEG